MIFSKQFAKELSSRAQVLELQVTFRSSKMNEINKNKTQISTDNNFNNILKSLHSKYRDFFNVDKTKQQSSH